MTILSYDYKQLLSQWILITKFHHIHYYAILIKLVIYLSMTPPTITVRH